MNADTKQYLADRGFVKDDRIARDLIVTELRKELPVVESLDEVIHQAALVVGLREQIVGASGDDEIDHDLNYLIGDLLSVSPKGRFQTSLENGYVLCAVRVKRALVEGEEPVSKSARFISSNPDVVEQYSQLPAVDRAVKAAQRANDVVEMTGRRIPLLASRRPVLARKAQEQLALAMPLEGS